MTEAQILHHALYWLSPRFTPVQIVEVLAEYLDEDRESIELWQGIDDAGSDLRRLAKRWRKAGDAKDGSK